MGCTTSTAISSSGAPSIDAGTKKQAASIATGANVRPSHSSQAPPQIETASSNNAQQPASAPLGKSIKLNPPSQQLDEQPKEQLKSSKSTPSLVQANEPTVSPPSNPQPAVPSPPVDATTSGNSNGDEKAPEHNQATLLEGKERLSMDPESSISRRPQSRARTPGSRAKTAERRARTAGRAREKKELCAQERRDHMIRGLDRFRGAVRKLQGNKALMARLKRESQVSRASHASLSAEPEAIIAAVPAAIAEAAAPSGPPAEPDKDSICFDLDLEPEVDEGPIPSMEEYLEKLRATAPVPE